MYLMYYTNEKGEKVYTLQVKIRKGRHLKSLWSTFHSQLPEVIPCQLSRLMYRSPAQEWNFSLASLSLDNAGDCILEAISHCGYRSDLLISGFSFALLGYLPFRTPA
jgi:hypothetical protein